MYDPAFTLDRIHEAEAAFGEPIVPHCREDIEIWTAQLADVYDDEGKQTRKLTKAEHAFIENERRLCALDFRYTATHYDKIRDLDGIVGLFKPNIAQNIVLDIWGELEAGYHSIEMQQLKARQLGVSTLTELAVAHRVQFHPDVNAVVASSSPEQSTKMSMMMELCWSEMPWWLMPDRTKDQAGRLVEFGGQNSGVSIQAGNQMTGLARGTTPDVVHLSELADFPDPEELVDASLFRAVHPAPSVFLVLESTAKGFDWWYRTWEANKELWPKGRARLCPLFLPWFIGDCWPTKTWLHSHPIELDWTPSLITAAHAERAAKYVANNPRLRKYLGDGWTMPRYKQWFYELDREEAKRKKGLNKFLSEMPSDDIEAFQSTNISAFDTEVIIVHKERIPEPKGVYGIRGDQNDLPPRMQPPEYDIDRSRKPIPIRCAWGTSLNTYELVPLKWEGYPGADSYGKIFIWDWPKDGFVYGLGCDTSDGVGEDNSAIELLRKGTHEDNDAQVAEYASPYVNAYNLWPVAIALATLYSTDVAGERKQCKAVIECKGNGEAVQLELRKRGWANFHQWMRYDGKRLRLKDAHKIGWFTNQWSRAAMMDLIMSALNDFWLDIASPWFVREMATLERDEIRQSMKAVYGAKDDRFMALGMVLFSMHVMETRGIKLMDRKRRDDDVDPLYSPGFQGSSDSVSGDMSTFMRLFGQGVRDEVKDRF